MATRDATRADVEQLCALIDEHAEYENHAPLRHDPDRIAEHLFGPAPKAWALIAHPGGKPDEVAGFALCWWTLSSWDGEPGIWLDDLFVRPAYRRRGLAAEMMLELRKRTPGRVAWEMQADNENGRKFYARLGADVRGGWVQYQWKAQERGYYRRSHA